MQSDQIPRETFLQNSWYCVSWAADLTNKPVGIRVLGQHLVLYRDDVGNPVILDGVCPHRFAPLARGRVVGDRLECGYHGLQFDRTGQCVLNPHGQQVVPPGAGVRSYPAVERNGAIWAWMGDVDSANPASIIDFDFVADTASWASSTGYLRVEADYRLVIDNLLDLTHGSYIHPKTVGIADAYAADIKVEHDFFTEGNAVHANYRVYNAPPSPLFRLFFDAPLGNLYAYMRWEPAASLILDISMTQQEEEKGGGVLMPSAHLIVPETETSCHYFFAIGRNVDRDNEEKTREMAEMARRAFVDEDEPMIEACEELMDGREFFKLKPLILETDRSGILARRTLGKLIKAERTSFHSVSESEKEKRS